MQEPRWPYGCSGCAVMIVILLILAGLMAISAGLPPIILI